MLRRVTTLLTLAAALLAPAAGRAHEWEEDYTEHWDESPPPDDYRVSVDMDASGSVSFDTFEGTLSPYGEWVVVGGYGRVWRPHVAGGWRPYFYGRWEWSSEGWLWVSDEPWGWAAYHYGRWTHDAYYGWVWVPGYQWAPAWVSWRYSGDVVGWAPLAPGVSVYVSVTPFVDTWWTFVPCNDFVAVPVYRVAYEPRHAHRYFEATAPAPARPGFREGPGRSVAAPAWGGPSRRAVEQRIGRPLAPVRVVAAPNPGAVRSRPGEVSVYRPELRGNAGRPVVRGNAPEVRGFSRPEGAPARGQLEVDRPDARIAPGVHGFDRNPGSTPAPATRGDDGRFAPRTIRPAAPEGAGARAERAWTLPSGSAGQGRPEPRSGGGASVGRPEVRGGEAPVVRSDVRGGGSGSQGEARGQGGGRRAVEAPSQRGGR